MAQIQKTIIREDIMDLLETLREQFETLETFEGKIPILEFEILKDNVRKLYDKLLMLQRFNNQAEHGVRAKQAAAEPLKAELPFASATPAQSTEKPKQQDPEPKPQDPEPVKENSDLFSSPASAFAEKLKEAREQAVGPKSNQPRQGDIKSLININDKFLFINELFDGDYKEYTKNIEMFNTFSDKGEAFGYLDSLLKENLWNSASTAFLKLKEIVEKRFG